MFHNFVHCAVTVACKLVNRIQMDSDPFTEMRTVQYVELVHSRLVFLIMPSMEVGQLASSGCPSLSAIELDKQCQ